MISPIENNGMIARVQDYSAMRQHEDGKLTGNQINLLQQRIEKSENNVRTVRQSDDSNKSDTRHDAKEEGKNKYFASQNKKKKSEEASDGKVIIKKQGGFDLKI